MNRFELGEVTFDTWIEEVGRALYRMSEETTPEGMADRYPELLQMAAALYLTLDDLGRIGAKQKESGRKGGIKARRLQGMAMPLFTAHLWMFYKEHPEASWAAGLRHLENRIPKSPSANGIGKYLKRHGITRTKFRR